MLARAAAALVAVWLAGACGHDASPPQAADAAVAVDADGSTSDSAGSEPSGGDAKGTAQADAASSDSLDGALSDTDVAIDAIAETDASAPADAATAEGDGGATAVDGADDASDTLASEPQPPPPVGPVAPVDPQTLPLAAMVEDTAAFGIDPKQLHQACVAVADFDGNGSEDFVVVQTDGSEAKIHAVLLGKGPPQHVTSVFDSTTMQANFGCSAVDMTSDGHPDLLFGGMSGIALYAGDGKGQFADKSGSWLPYIMAYEAFSPVPADLDNDGDLDVFIGAGFAPPVCDQLDCAYTATDLLCTLDPPIPLLDNLQDRVLIQGAALPLSDETATWKPFPGGTQTVAMAADVDQDGKMDMLVADDFGSARVLHNLGGTFATHDTDVGIAPYSGAMGWAVGDFNGDALPDLVVAESGPTPVYLQQSKGKVPSGKPFHFIDMGGLYQTWAPHWAASSWAPVIADFDHNGFDDLWVGNAGNLSPDMAGNPKALCAVSKQQSFASMFNGLPSIDVLFLGQSHYAATAHRIAGGQYAHIITVDQRPLDLDGDGDLDMVQTRPSPDMTRSVVRILRNDLPKQGGSFRVVVSGKGKNRDALGARVTAIIGGKLRTRYLNGSGAFGGTPTRFAHFGLGSATEAQQVQVRWPDGSLTMLGSAKDGQTLNAKWQ